VSALFGKNLLKLGPSVRRARPTKGRVPFPTRKAELDLSQISATLQPVAANVALPLHEILSMRIFGLKSYGHETLSRIKYELSSPSKVSSRFHAQQNCQLCEWMYQVARVQVTETLYQIQTEQHSLQQHQQANK
jgi:hypothetical protein